MSEVEALPSGVVLLSIPSTVLWPPPTPLSCFYPIFGGYLISSITQRVNPRQVEVSFVPLSPMHTSHSQYPEFRPRFQMVSNPPWPTGLHPRSRGSTEPPYTILSQHNCMADIYEACSDSLSLRAVCSRAPTVWVRGHVYPALLPCFSRHPHVCHSYSTN